MGGERVPGPLNQEAKPLQVQDGTSNVTPSSAPGPIDNGQGEQGTFAKAQTHVDSRVDDDPEFLLCLALTYVGLPPNLWRTVVTFFLEASLTEFKQRLGDERGTQEFGKFKTEFQAMKPINKFKLVIVFVGECKIGLIPVDGIARCRALQEKALELLARAGIKRAPILAASQIVRKIFLYLELAYAADCAAFCAATNAANAIIAFSTGALEAIANFTGLAGQAVDVAVQQVLVRPVLIAKAMMDPTNWDTTPMPSAALTVRLLGSSLFSQLKPDDADAFLDNLAHSISTFQIPLSVVEETAAAMTKTIKARGGVQSTFTSQLILGLTPLAFVELLKEWQLLRFLRDPAQIADEAIRKK